MQTNRNRLIETLRRWPGLDDDQLSPQSGITPRQTVNQICRRLEAAGQLRRTTGPEGKIINTLIDGAAAPASPRAKLAKAAPSTEANNFQRIGSISNAHAGREFEYAACAFFAETGVALTPNFGILVGHVKKRMHRFDLGSNEPSILVECNPTLGHPAEIHRVPKSAA